MIVTVYYLLVPKYGCGKKENKFLVENTKDCQYLLPLFTRPLNLKRKSGYFLY